MVASREAAPLSGDAGEDVKVYNRYQDDRADGNCDVTPSGAGLR